MPEPKTNPGGKSSLLYPSSSDESSVNAKISKRKRMMRLLLFTSFISVVSLLQCTEKKIKT